MSKAIERLESLHKPALYYGMMTMVDSELTILPYQQILKSH